MTTDTQHDHEKAPSQCRDRLRTLCILALFGLAAVLAITLFDASSHAEAYTAPSQALDASACSACATDKSFCAKTYFAGATSNMQACDATSDGPCCCPTSARRSDGIVFVGACATTAHGATCVCSFTPTDNITNHGTFNGTVSRYAIMATMAALVLTLGVLALVERRQMKHPPAHEANAVV